ncbi:hypothetical protein HAX54_042912 [Datura stramonium]|uniref:TF-B3 domain-containing protein n=1 Tax=Datura stramonium TaxID=4076 RepID=A0ABS8SMX2_DATST|nr:hypothetical protein [Datura stramonium]
MTSFLVATIIKIYIYIIIRQVNSVHAQKLLFSGTAAIEKEIRLMEGQNQGGAEVRRLHIIYFLSRKGRIEHPHLIRVHHFSRNGIRLRDVKRWLGELRGKDMAESFAWSYKRKYKTGYVWQDLLDEDLITPISDNEYVLKGSEIPSITPIKGKIVTLRLSQRKKVNDKMVTPIEHVSIPDNLPEFFKIYHPEICYPQLRIPPAFLKFFNGDIPSISVLEDLAARFWKVIVEKNDRDFFFTEGWPDFVLENNLEYGDFLTFSYSGNSKFYVKIYGKNGSLKQDVPALKEPQLVPLDEENVQQKGVAAQPADQTLNGSRDLVASVTSFEVVIRASHLRRSRLNFPAAFGNRYLMRKQPLKATLRTDSGSWTVVASCYDRLELREGMHKFIADNALRVNDVCRFKVIDDEKLILEVCIMRQAQVT